MRLLFILLLTITSIYAQKVEITADDLEADEKSHISTLKGNVSIKKGADSIKADKLEVFFDKNNKPTKYVATGDIRFHILTDTREFQGKGEKLIYDPSTKKYEISGGVVIEELKEHQKLIGEKIVIDRVSGKSKIEGGKRPIKLIFEVKE